MREFTPWLGLCHLRQVADDSPDPQPTLGKCQFQRVNRDSPEANGFEAYVAVWADGRDSFETQINAHFEGTDHGLFWAEEVHEAVTWLNKFGHNNAIMGLARKVDSSHPVEIHKLADIGADGQPLEDEGYLTITEHDIPPLPEQKGVPFWEREWIIDELKELLFGQSEDGNTLKTYLIVDATLRKKITGFFNLDVQDVPVRCLFKGEAEEGLKEVAPYLVDMTLPEGAWNDKDKVPEFHKDFFHRHWGENTGIIVRTSASFNEVWGHFRKFTKVQVEEDKRWVFFRFWDPRIVDGYFNCIKNIPEKSAQWVNMRNGEKVETIFGNRTDTEQPWSIKPNWKKLGGVESSGQPMLSGVEISGLKSDVETRYLKELCEYFETYYPHTFLRLSPKKQMEYLKQSTKLAKQFGYTKRGSLRLFIELRILLGVDFYRDPLFDPIKFDIYNVPNQMEAATCLHEEVGDCLSKIYGDSNTLLFDSLKRLHNKINDLKHIPKNEISKNLQYIYPQKFSLLKKDIVHEITEILSDTIKKSDIQKVPSEYLFVLCLMRMYFGIGFTNDPTLPWIRKALHFDLAKNNVFAQSKLKKVALIWLNSIVDGRDKVNGI